MHAQKFESKEDQYSYRFVQLLCCFWVKEYLQEDELPLHMAKCCVESDESDIEAEIQDWIADGEWCDEDNVRKQYPKMSKRRFQFVLPHFKILMRFKHLRCVLGASNYLCLDFHNLRHLDWFLFRVKININTCIPKILNNTSQLVKTSCITLIRNFCIEACGPFNGYVFWSLSGNEKKKNWSHSRT